jgi:hypothetical protein
VYRGRAGRGRTRTNRFVGGERSTVSLRTTVSDHFFRSAHEFFVLDWSGSGIKSGTTRGDDTLSIHLPLKRFHRPPSESSCQRQIARVILSHRAMWRVASASASLISARRRVIPPSEAVARTWTAMGRNNGNLVTTTSERMSVNPLVQIASLRGGTVEPGGRRRGLSA